MFYAKIFKNDKKVQMTKKLAFRKMKCPKSGLPKILTARKGYETTKIMAHETIIKLLIFDTI